MRTDGSDLRQMTDLKADLSIAVWSADGNRRCTTSSALHRRVVLRRVNKGDPADREILQEPPAAAVQRRIVVSRRQADCGPLLDVGGNPRTVAVWEVATGTVRDPERFRCRCRSNLPSQAGSRIPEIPLPVGLGPVLVDSTTGRIDSGQRSERDEACILAGAGRAPMVERATLDADVWLMEIKR